MNMSIAARWAAVSLILMPVTLGAQTPLDELDALLANIRSMTADVTQLIVESDGGVLEESEIRMNMKKPDGFYWETLTPFPELIVTNGRLLWNYQPDLEQVVIEDWDTSRSELAAQLLNGQTQDLGNEYEIAINAASSSENKEFRLIPKATDSVYSEITISFVNAKLDMIYLHSKNGQQTVWQFSNMTHNADLPDSLFEFEPPENVEVIRNSYTN